MIGNMIAVSSDGTATTVEQGYTWMNTSDGAKLILTQVQEEDDDNKTLIWLLASLAAVAAVVSVANDDDCGRSCS